MIDEEQRVKRVEGIAQDIAQLNDEEHLAAILAAITASMVGEGEDLVVDLEALENRLAAAGLNCTATTNKGALAAELTVLREEARVQRARYRHSQDESIADLLSRLATREREIEERLWPK